jgi:hypothetical protein
MGGTNCVGKTSILYYLKPRSRCDVLQPTHTIDFNVEAVEHATTCEASWLSLNICIAPC